MGSKDIKYSLDEKEFMQIFEKKRAKNKNFDLLNICHVKTAIDAFMLLSQDWFQLKVIGDDKIFGLCFELDVEIEENFKDEPKFNDFAVKDVFMIAFQSKVGAQGSKIFWKAQTSQNFYSLLIEDDEDSVVSDFAQDFLMGEIKEGGTGVLEYFQSKTSVRLHELGNQYGNLLEEAAGKIETSVVPKLLKLEFDPDDAIDIAWWKFNNSIEKKKENVNKILLDLLYANSKLPDGFKYDDASNEVKDFVDMCESLRLDLQSNDLEALKQKLNDHSNLIHFYDRNNQSLFVYAVKNNKFEIFKFLGRGITIGGHEELPKEYYLPDNLKQLRKLHSLNAIELPESHILKLRSSTKIGNNEKFYHKKWKFITEAYELMSKNPLHDKIMKISAECRNLKIFLDTKHETIHYLNPFCRSSGTIDGTNTIYIGAKYLTDDERKYEVIGVIAHELCHLATKIAFMNPNFNPYPMGESTIKTQYLECVMKQCEEAKEQSDFINNVFHSYSKELQDSEMIVTVPEMLMFYYKKPKELEQQKEVLTKLFEYVQKVVEPEYEICLPVLKKVCDENNKDIKYEILTSSMKAKILHKDIVFQGQKTTFYQICGDNPKVLNLLSPSQIRNVLLKGTELTICDNLMPTSKDVLVDRDFIGHDPSDQNRNLDFILLRTHVFILADNAGTGKTTTFMKHAREYKEQHKDFWISFINLRRHGNVFDKFINKEIRMPEVLEMLFKIMELKLKLEQELFSICLKNNKVVLFFDGIDEISPKYNYLLTSVLMTIRQEVIDSCARQIWRRLCDCRIKSRSFVSLPGRRSKRGKEEEFKSTIFVSTRPHYRASLQRDLQSSTYKFSPCVLYVIKNFITSMWKSKKMAPDESIPEKIINYLTIEKSSPFSQYELYNNLLLIKLITSLFIKNPELDINSLNQFGLFTSIIEGQKFELGNRVQNENCDKFNTNLKVWDVHVILALIVIIFKEYSDKFNFKFEDLAVVTIWMEEMGNLGEWTDGSEELLKSTYVWTSDVIQLYGFVCVDQEFSKDSIQFTHKTYAEYFVARFIVHSFSNRNLRDEEVKRIFDILDFVLTEAVGFEVVRNFMYSYMTKEWKDQKRKFSNPFKILLIDKLKDIHRGLKNGKTYQFKSYNYIYSGDKELSRMLWDAKVILNDIECTESSALSDIQKAIFMLNCDNVSEIFEMAEFSIEPNYFAKFNQSGRALLTDDEIEQLRDVNQADESWTREKTFLKFYDFIDKNFNSFEKIKFVNPENISNITSHKNLFALFQKFLESGPTLDVALSFLQAISFQSIADGFFQKILDVVDPKYGNEFYSITRMSNILGQIIDSQHIKDFYSLTYFIAIHSNSNEDFLKIITNMDGKHFFRGFTKEMYPHFELFILNSLGNKIYEIKEYMENLVYSKVNHRAIYGSERENFANLFKEVYLGDEFKTQEIVKKYQDSVEGISLFTRPQLM